MTNRDEWLDSLKPGDKVAASRYGKNHWIIKIERVTKTMIIGGGYRFSKATGVQIGEGWWKAHIQPITQELKDQLERTNLVVQLTALISDKELSLETLRAMLNVAKEPQGEDKCMECLGDGKQCLAGHSAHRDNWYKCDACNGTGKASNAGQGVALNYAIVHKFAVDHGIDYNTLAKLVRDSVVATHMQGVDADAIERAARSLHENGADNLCSDVLWDDLHESERNQYRSWARAALKAATHTQEK